MHFKSLKVEFPNDRGEMLAGRLELAPNHSSVYALFAHCFSCSKDLLASARISKALCRLGVNVLRFDFTGLGHSEGAFSNTSFSSNVADLERAAQFLRETYEAPRLLIGHSLGGSAVLMAAKKIPEALGLAIIAAPSNPEHVTHLFGDSLCTIEADGKARISIAGRSFTIKKQFVDDLRNHSLDDAVKNLDRALLIFHSPADDVVSIDHAKYIFDLAPFPKSFITLDGADHLLTRKEDAHFVARTLASWAARYVHVSEIDFDLEED